MRLIKPSYQILEQQNTILGIQKHIEYCGRVAYKSEDKITEDSAEPFVNMIIRRGHTAVLEHGTVYLTVPDGNLNCEEIIEDYCNNPYSFVIYNSISYNYHITTNYRVLIENNWLEDLQYQCEPTRYHEKRISVKFICDRAIANELVRHRVFSFTQESSRFCNYSKDKFGNELTFIMPCWTNKRDEVLIHNLHIAEELEELHEFFGEEFGNFLYTMYKLEATYFTLLKQGWTPQQARSVLPLSTKTEIIMTGTLSQWKEFFKLRCAPDAHPQMRELTIPLQEEFNERFFK